MPQRIETVQSSQTFEHAADMSTSNTQTPKGYLPQHNIAERLLMKIPQSYIVTVSGGLAGAASGIVSCPLDVIKTKLQAQGGFRLRQARESPSSIAAAETYRGVKGTAQMIWREEGIRGMYRGLGPMLLGYVPTWAVYLTVYNSTQRYFNTKTDNKFVANMYASLSGGTCSTLVTNPIWVIKTRLMSQSDANTKSNHVRAPWHYRNTLDAAVKMYTAEGLKSFYSGLTPALLGLSHVAIQFPLYEVFKVKFTGVDPNNPPAEGEQKGQFWAISAAVFLSKVIASTATYPHEVVRTRLQTQQRSDPHHATENLAYRGAPGRDGDSVRPTSGTSSNSTANKSRYRGTIQTCKAILLEEGWRGFYAGLGTNLIRAVPSAMTTLLTFEYLKKAFVTSREDALSRA